MMEAARTSEMLVNVYQTIRRYNPEDSHLRKELISLKKVVSAWLYCMCEYLWKISQFIFSVRYNYKSFVLSIFGHTIGGKEKNLL
jgi:hypothetical protein